MKKYKHGAAVGTYNPQYNLKEPSLRNQVFLTTDRFQYENMHSIHFPKQAEGESITDFDAIHHKCQRKLYPIMPAHMELAMLRSDKMDSIYEKFGSAGKAL